MSAQIEIILIACVVALACALPGVFLVLRKVSLMSDAISHAILLGIVVSFFIVKDLASPFLMLGAVVTGIITVSLTELLIGTRKMKEDASIGLVFPIFFSLGVILISKYAGDVHLDLDAVLLGELAFAPFDRLIAFGLDLPRSLVVMGIILALNIGFIALFYKELKLSTFDEGLAIALGFSPAIVHYALMTMVSVAAVGAFDAVGSILVVALMIAPPAAAFMLTYRLHRMILLSGIVAILSAVFGYYLARLMDANIAGSMAMMAGFFFVLALLFSPERGLLAQALSHRRKKVLFASQLLLVHLLDHEGKPDEGVENTVSHARSHLRWKETLTRKAVGKALGEKWILQEGDRLHLTLQGRRTARAVMTDY
jgi:manganese/zinc/iron transport system permease protein